MNGHARLALRWSALLVLAGGCLAASTSRHGPSPRLWIDTLNDERLVTACLEQDRCVLHGMPVSFGGLVQGSGWHQILAAFHHAGLGRQGAHWLGIAMDCLALLLVFSACARLAGPWSGLVGCAVGLAMADSFQQTFEMLWNYTPIWFCSGLVLALSLRGAGTGQRSALAATLAGGGLAVLVNSHLVGATLLPGLLLAVLLGPRAGRWRDLAVCCAAFAGWLLLLAPAAWMHNLTTVLAGGWLPVDPGGPALAASSSRIPTSLLLALAGLLAALAVALRVRGPARGHALVLTAFILPGLAAFLGGQTSLALAHTDRYLLPILPAVAVSLAWFAGLVVSVIIKHIAKYTVIKLTGRIPGPAQMGLAAAATGLVVALLPGPDFHRPGMPPARPLFDEVEEAGAALRQAGWGRADIIQFIKNPHQHLVIETIIQSQAFRQARPDEGCDPGRDNVYLVNPLDPVDLPQPPSGSWKILKQRGSRIFALQTAEAWLDWSRFAAAHTPSDGSLPELGSLEWAEGSLRSEPAGPGQPAYQIPSLPGVPVRRPTWLVLEVPVRCRVGGARQVITMPRLQGGCAGRVLSAPSWPGSEVDPEGRSAILVCPEGGSGPDEAVRLAWEIAGPECKATSYYGFPPYLIEADELTSGQLEALLARSTRRGP